MNKFKKVTKMPQEVMGMNVLGGYHYWNWKFPFRHYRAESLYIITKGGLYRWTDEGLKGKG